MKTTRITIVTILLFGAIWGGLEALVSGTIDGLSAPVPRSVILAAIAVLVLAMARYLAPGRGSTLAIGLVAMAVKAVSLPSLWNCQLAAVIGQALICDIAFSIAENRRLTERLAVMIPVMIATSYVNSLLFSFSQAYLFQNSWWLDRGPAGLLAWSFGTGSLAALASGVGFAGGMLLAARIKTGFESLVTRHGVACQVGSLALALCVFVAVGLA